MKRGGRQEVKEIDKNRLKQKERRKYEQTERE